MPKYFITHIFNETMSSAIGSSSKMKEQKTIFLTAEENTEPKEFFMGVDNNPIDHDDIDYWIENKMLKAIKDNFPELHHENHETLYVNIDNDSYFFADGSDSKKNVTNLELNFS